MPNNRPGIDANWRLQLQILTAMDAALKVLRTPEGHNSGAFAAVSRALAPLCEGAMERRRHVLDWKSDPAAWGPLGS